MSILAAGLWTTLACAATDFEVETGVRAEARTGQMAAGANTLVTAADFELTPLLQFALRSPRTAILANYQPRFFYRVPNPLTTPLVLHQANAEFRHLFDAQLSGTARAYIASGEVDFSRSLLTFGVPGAIDDVEPQAPPSTLPESSVIGYNNLGASAELVHQIDASQRLAFTVRASENRPGATNGASVFPTQQWFEAGSIYNLAITQIDAASASVTAGLGIYSPGPQFVTLQPSANWTRTRRHAEFTASAGLLTAWQQADDPNATDQRLRWLPFGELGYSRRWQISQKTLTTGARMGATSYFDPVQATLDPRGFITLSASLALPPDLAVRVDASIYSPVRFEPRAADDAAYDPTLALVNAVLDYNLGDNLQVQVGCRANLHGPYLSQTWAMDTVSQVEAIGFLAITAGYDLVE